MTTNQKIENGLISAGMVGLSTKIPLAGSAASVGMAAFNTVRILTDN